MLIVLIITLVIIAILLVAKGSPLDIMGRGTASNQQSLKKQTEQLQVDVDKLNKQTKTELNQE